MAEETRTFNLELDYQRPAPEPGAEQISNSALTVDYTQHLVSSTHPQGLEGHKRRIYGRLQRKMDAALEAGTPEIMLTEDEAHLLWTSLPEVKVPAAIAKYFDVFADEVERACAKK